MNGNNAQSFSQLDDYGRCPKLYELRYVLGLQPKRKNVNLRKGSAIHRLLQAMNTGEDVYEVFTTETAAIHEDPVLFDDEKQEHVEVWQDALRIVLNYIDYYGDSLDDEEVLHVEESFVLMLDTGAVLSCTPDLVAMKSDGVIVVRDYKSTDQTPSFSTPLPDYQVALNSAAVQAMYPDHGIVFEYDRLRKKVPTEPRLNKTGPPKVSNLNRIDTTYEMLRDFIQNDAPGLMDDPEHRRRLAELRDNNRFFYRDQITPSDTYLANALDDVTETVRRIEDSHERGVFPRQYLANGMRSCDSCSMKSLCQAQLLGWDIEAVIEEEYEPRDTSYKEYETEEES